MSRERRSLQERLAARRGRRRLRRNWRIAAGIIIVLVLVLAWFLG
jgi:hypothetical protein